MSVAYSFRSGFDSDAVNHSSRPSADQSRPFVLANNLVNRLSCLSAPITQTVPQSSPSFG